ncbi:MAG TPA: hypothetical protein VK671_01030 [Mucilaginibacter sp.]|nr:hypothetical protein [Mucilaginibacter sp.]
MENTTIESPKDEHITNKDDSITNKDGNNYLEKGEQPTDQNNPDKESVRTAAPRDDSKNTSPIAEEGAPKKDSKSKKWVL